MINWLGRWPCQNPPTQQQGAGWDLSDELHFIQSDAQALLGYSDSLRLSLSEYNSPQQEINPCMLCSVHGESKKQMYVFGKL